jgi:membrane-bound lytic murein transglycosylase A
MSDPARGPVGGAGVPLTTGRSLAVDRTIWPYGLPVWISVSPLTPGGPRAPLDRLMIAQDTGSAIVGPARGDFFMGSGMQAGTRAGLVRDSMRFIVLLPRGE